MFDHCLHRGIAALLIACAFLFSAPVQARLHHVKPGNVPELEAGEGLLVVGVDTNMPISRVRVRKDDAVFGGGDMKDLPEGRSLRLYALPAGRYEWAQLKPFSNFIYDLRDEPEFEFVVEAGKINYAGDLQFRAKTVDDSRFHVSNRGLGVIDWLNKEHPRVFAGYTLAYTGYYPDPFPEFYRAIVAKAGTEPVASTRFVAPPKPGKLPLAVRDLWKDDRVLMARINPAGDLIAVHVHTSEKRWDVELVDLAAGTVSALATSNVPFGYLSWASDGTILMPVREPGAEEIHLARIGASAGGKRNITRMKLPRKGYLIDTLPNDDDHILFGSLGSRGELLVHRMDISSPAALAGFSYNARERLNLGVTDDLAWYTDGQSRLRLALATRDDRNPPAAADGDEKSDEKPRKRVLMHGRDGVFREVMEIDDEEPFDPEGVSADGSLIYGITEKDRAQKELVAFDPATGKITRTLFSKPGTDVVTALFNEAHEVAGVGYYQGGLYVSEYFDAGASSQVKLLQNTFPGKTVIVGDRSRDGKQMLVWVEAGDQPARLYHLDATARRASLVDETMPGLKSESLAPSKAFNFKGVDGSVLEAFITLPRAAGRHPLVVFPHGGPIGVSDKLHFDPEVQFLASLGYAVLRVNYRGSDGYGKAFREMGYRKYGTAIEDDIDAATRHAIASYPIDESRMCAVGTSYGGYSSLVMAIRWPQRFRCVVSVAGVSDRILFFTASDSGRNKDTRKQMEKLIGDPHTELEAMKASSPIYHYQDLKVPVMIVHGKEDYRVDYEHARRLQRMLEIDGRPPVGLVFDKEGHGVRKIENVETQWNGIAGFLQSYLDAPGGNANPGAAAP